MSVVSCNELVMDQDGEETPTGRKYVRCFLIECDSVNDNHYTIYSYSGLPGIYAEHPNDSAALLRSKRPQRYEDRLKWKVFLTYETAPSPIAAVSGGIIRPDMLPPRIRFGTVRREKPLELAYQEDDEQGHPTLPVINTAGDFFDPPLMTPENVHRVTITRNEKKLDFSEDALLKYKHTVNADAVTVAGIKCEQMCAYMDDIEAENSWTQSGVEYWVVTYQVSVAPVPWERRVVNKGYRLKGEPVSMGREIPVLLAEDGTQLPESQWNNPHILTFNEFFARDWSSLKLPATAKGIR